MEKMGWVAGAGWNPFTEVSVDVLAFVFSVSWCLDISWVNRSLIYSASILHLLSVTLQIRYMIPRFTYYHTPPPVARPGRCHQSTVPLRHAILPIGHCSWFRYLALRRCLIIIAEPLLFKVFADSLLWECRLWWLIITSDSEDRQGVCKWSEEIGKYSSPHTHHPPQLQKV